MWGAYVEAKAKPARVGAVSSPCGFQELNPNHHTW